MIRLKPAGRLPLFSTFGGGSPLASNVVPVVPVNSGLFTQKLLASPEVNLLEATVMADSLPCQDQTAHLITREKGGDYLLQVRANQPTLHALVQSQLAQASPLFAPPTASTGAPSCAS